MEANWETVGDDLDMLLELEDDFGRPPGPKAGREQPPSKAMPISVSPCEPRSTRGNPDSTNPRNWHKQLQSELKQGKEDGSKSTSKDNANEVTRPRTSSYTTGGEHDKFDSLRNREHETSSRHEQRFKVADVNYIDEEEPVPSKQVFSRGCPDDWQIEEERNDEDREQDVRPLSGVRRGRTTETGGCSEVSRGSRGRASERVRHQDGNVGAGWDDPFIVDDFANRGVGCNERGFPENAPDFSLLSPPEMRPALKAAQDKQKEFSPPVTVLGYKIPGPAGALQSCVKSTGPKIQGLGLIDRHFGPGREPVRHAASPDTLDFREGPWLAAMDFLKNGNDSSRSTIVTIKATTGHIPQLVAIINTVVPNKFGDLAVTLKDPTGTVGATIHRKVLTELDDGHLIAAGAVIIIRKVAVFSPTRMSHYLNITKKNVDQIFGRDTNASRKKKAVNDCNIGAVSGSENPISEPRLDGRSQMKTAAKEGYQSETIAPNFGISERQEVRDPTRTLGKDAFIPVDCPTDKSPASGTRTRKRLPLPTTLGHAVDSRKRAPSANAGVGDSRASQDATAKAAGWDFSEDPELLLGDENFF